MKINDSLYSTHKCEYIDIYIYSERDTLYFNLNMKQALSNEAVSCIRYKLACAYREDSV